MKIYMVINQEYFHLGNIINSQKSSPSILGLFEDFKDAKKCLLDAREKYFAMHMLESPYYELAKKFQEEGIRDMRVDEIRDIVHECPLVEIHSDELNSGLFAYIAGCTNVLYVKELEVHMKGETE